jgi:outer membrane protein OmpA-like peptidoglycan-associated protein
VGLVVALHTASAWAGSAGIDVEQFHPQIDGRGLFSAESADGHLQWQWGTGLVLHYAKNPLIVAAGRDKAADLVDDRLTASVLLSLGLLRWLEVGAALPVALSNDQNATLRGGTQVTGLGSMRFHLKLRLLTEGLHGVGLAFLPVLRLPTGNHNAFLGQNGVAFAPMLLFERHVSAVRFLVNLGFTFREEATFQNLRVGNELAWRFGIGWRLHERVEAAAELTGATAGDDPFGADERRNPLELMVGARVLLGDRFQLWAGAGPGLTQGYGSPTFRFFAGAIFSPHVRDTDADGIPDREDRCPRVRGPRANRGCPWGDSDGDGLTDNVDDCPTVPGPAENRGCPWPDADGDGVPDKEDRCPTVYGPMLNKGCPWTDTDRDGLPDRDDDCPTVPGPVANRGCPWPDADRDGIPDRDDKCPTVPGPAKNQGCPWPDTDKDGIPDKDDQCPTVPGPFENQGCPYPDADKDGIPDKDDDCPQQAGPATNKGCPLRAVVVTKTEVRIRDQIFFRFNSATILPKSFQILNEVAKTLRAFPNIREVEIQGHTDDVGGRRFNLRLSQKRAEAVRRYLVRKGVSPKRLVARGYGEERPLRLVDRRRMSKAELREARALNRRVQFVIVRQ